MLDLKPHLDPLYFHYQDTRYLTSDPLEFVHFYQDFHDQEAVALIAALLAYGKVGQIRKSVKDVLERMSQGAKSPAHWVRGLGDQRKLKEFEKSMEGFTHRFNVGSDLVALLKLLERSWQTHGSLGMHFKKFLRPEHPHIELALNGLIQEWRAWDSKYKFSKAKSFSYLLTAPESGSCCKRWCMFLRWMGRKDVLDPGLWSGNAVGLRAQQLILPLDTHTGRISQYIGLTQRKTLGWKAAVEITDALRACDSDDPVKYDFALSRLGILDLCQKRFRVEICQNCELLKVCRFASQHAR